MLNAFTSLGPLAMAFGVLTFGSSSVVAQQSGQCTSNLSVSITVPPEGAANLTATVVPEVTLAPPGQGVAGSYHFAWVADLDVAAALPAGRPVQAGNPRIVVGSNRTQNFDGLGGGDHTVTVVLLGFDGIPCSPLVSAAASFRLQGPKPPATGTATPTPHSDSSTLQWLGAALVAVSGVAAGVCMRHR